MSGASFLDDLPDDPDAALAAEYVLRLLDPAEEAACVARIAGDPAFAAEVDRWQGALSGLDAGFPPAAPPPRLQARIEERLFGRPASLAERLWGSAALWRGVAAAAVAGALALAYLGPRPPEPELPQLVATVLPTTGDVQLVALLDPQAGRLRVTRLAGSAPQGRSLELWILPEGDAAPVSLGVVPAEPRFAVPVPASLAARVGPGTAILVSDEAEGGSPTGQPQGAVLASGAISEL